MSEEGPVAPPGGDGMSVGCDPLSPPQIYQKGVVEIVDRNGVLPADGASPAGLFPDVARAGEAIECILRMYESTEQAPKATQMLIIKTSLPNKF